jgi:uncharacterized protein (DUF983 family)
MVEAKKEKPGIKLVCPRCGHEWMYNGKSVWYTSCGVCKGMINIRKKKKELGILE